MARVLKELEQNHPLVGTSMLGVFFPGGLRAKDDDLRFWRDAIQQRIVPNEYGERVDVMPTLSADPDTDTTPGGTGGG